MKKLIITNENVLNVVAVEKQLSSYTSSIKNLVDGVAKNYIYVGWYLLKIKNLDLNLLEYEDVFDYADKTFGIKKTSVYNMMAVAEKFCNFDGYYSYSPTLKTEFEGFSYSQLVELLSVENIDPEKYKSMPVSKIRETKVLDKVNSYVDDIVIDDLKFIDNKILSFFKEYPILCNSLDDYEDYDLDFIPYEDMFKYKEMKANSNIDSYQVAYEKKYKCWYKNDSNYYFNMRYLFVKKTDKLECGVEITFDFDGWQDHFKVIPKIYVDFVNGKDINNIENEIDLLFQKVFVYRFTKYDKKNKQIIDSKKTIDEHVQKNMSLIKELGFKESFRYGDYKNDLLQIITFKDYIDRLESKVEVNDDSIMIIDVWGKNDYSLYFCVCENLYVLASSYNFDRIYKHEYDISHKDYSGNVRPHIFSALFFQDKDYYKMLFEYLTNRYKSNS